MPDVFVPWDSTWYSDYYADLRRKGLINQFTVNFVDKNRTDLMGRFPELNSFIKGFNVDEDIINAFHDLAKSENVEFDEKGWNSSGETIRYQIKALIARNLWDMSAYYEVMTGIDDAYHKALETINNDALFAEMNLTH